MEGVIVIKKILLILPRLSGHGGTETVINYWSQFFKKNHQEYQYKVIAPNGMEDSQWVQFQEFFQISHPVSRNKQVRHIQSLCNLTFSMLNFSPDLVVVMNTTTLKAVYVIRKLFRLNYKISTWLHFSLQYGEGFDTQKLKLADFHLCISQGIYQQLKNLQIKNGVYVIGNPIEKKSKSIKLHPPVPTFVYIGRLMLHGQKNLVELLTACSKLRGDWKLDLYGTGPDTELSKIRSFANDNDIASNIRFHGWLNDPWQNIHSVTALALTSSFEGLPMVLLEACSYGLPVISSDCPTGPHDIVSGNNGFLYTPGNSNELAYFLQCFVDGAVTFNSNVIKSSVEFFYSEKYFSRLNDVLEVLTV